MEDFDMNHPPSGSLFLSKAIPGFINYKTAEGLALRTIDSHERLLNKWLEHIGDQQIGKITTQDVVAYLSWLRNEYTPRRFNGKTHPLSPKSLRNVWVTLSSFYSWAARELGVTQIMKSVPEPHINKTPIEPLTQEEVERMLKACITSREARTNNRRSFTMRLRFSHRDQAIILTLIDTGLRAMELCKLLIGNIDLKTGQVEVKHGVIGGAKGGKGRTVYLGKTTRRALWRYLVDREDAENADAPVFLDQHDRHYNPNSLRQLIKDIAERAGVKGAYPHKFRHTFAITYLRSGGDIFTLQSLLGHSSLEMVRHYAQIAEIDVAQAHRRASPADNWRL
jgi:integrase/recombinase XerD